MKSISDVISMLATHLESFAKIVKIKKRKKKSLEGKRFETERKMDRLINDPGKVGYNKRKIPF